MNKVEVRDTWSKALNEHIKDREERNERRPVKKAKIKYTLLFKSGASITGVCRLIEVTTKYDLDGALRLRSLKIEDENGVDDSFYFIDLNEVVAVIKEVTNE